MSDQKNIFFKLFLNHIIEKQPFCKLWPYMTTIGRLAHTTLPDTEESAETSMEEATPKTDLIDTDETTTE